MTEAYVRADIPAAAVDVLALGRLTALRKYNGRVRGILTGSVFRTVASHCLAIQFAEVFKLATAPFQFALDTHARSDIPHGQG